MEMVVSYADEHLLIAIRHRCQFPQHSPRLLLYPHHNDVTALSSRPFHDSRHLWVAVCRHFVRYSKPAAAADHGQTHGRTRGCDIIFN